MLLCSNTSNTEESTPVELAVSKMMTIKRDGRDVVEIIRLSNNSSHRVDHPSWEGKASPSVFRDRDSNKSVESTRLPRVVAGLIKVLVDGAEVQPNPVAGKEVKSLSVY